MTEKYIPALRFRSLTRYYDLLVAWTTNESKFRSLMLNQLRLRPSDAFLDVACGTGTFLEMVNRSNSGRIFLGLDGDSAVLEIAK